VGFLAITLEPREVRVRQAVAALGIETPVAIARGSLLAPLGVNAVPSTIFVTADGTIAATASGYRSREFIEARIEELLEAAR
jgi:hypothetical protein